MSKLAFAQKLMAHAREITSDVYKLSVVLIEEDTEAASKKLAYGKQVLTSVTKLLENPGDMDSPEMQEIIYELIVSIRPTLATALGELEQRIEKKEYFRIHEELMERQEAKSIEEVEEEVANAVDWDKIEQMAEEQRQRLEALMLAEQVAENPADSHEEEEDEDSYDYSEEEEEESAVEEAPEVSSS